MKSNINAQCLSVNTQIERLEKLIMDCNAFEFTGEQTYKNFRKLEERIKTVKRKHPWVMERYAKLRSDYMFRYVNFDDYFQKLDEFKEKFAYHAKEKISEVYYGRSVYGRQKELRIKFENKDPKISFCTCGGLLYKSKIYSIGSRAF